MLSTFQHRLAVHKLSDRHIVSHHEIFMQSIAMKSLLLGHDILQPLRVLHRQSLTLEGKVRPVPDLVSLSWITIEVECAGNRAVCIYATQVL